MGELFSYLGFALHISMVIGGILAVVSLFSGRRPRMSSREMKIAWAIVGATVLVVLIIITIALVL
jgi:heme/copper-type cytochrome/quinol oxidase subunit 1